MVCLAWSSGKYPLQDDGRSMFEEDVLCVLDFYVHESVQRKGKGFSLFNSALKVGVRISMVFQRENGCVGKLNE